MADLETDSAPPARTSVPSVRDAPAEPGRHVPSMNNSASAKTWTVRFSPLSREVVRRERGLWLGLPMDAQTVSARALIRCELSLLHSLNSGLSVALHVGLERPLIGHLGECGCSIDKAESAASISIAIVKA